MYTCQLCALKFKTIIDYNKHQKLHMNNLNYLIPCAYKDCNVKCKNYGSFKQHILRFHQRVEHCLYKKCAYQEKKSKLSKHYRDVHSKQSSDLITCKHCLTPKKVFKNISAYRVHVIRNHRFINNENDSATCQLSTREIDVLPSTFEHNHQFLKDEQERYLDITFQQSAKDDRDTVKNPTQSTIGNGVNILSQMYLKLSTKHFVTEPIIQHVVDNVHSAFKVCADSFQTSLLSSNIPESEKQDVSKMFLESFNSFKSTHDPICGILRNTYNRDLLFKSDPKYVKPIEIIIKDGGKETPFRYTYVPILETLKTMLQNKNVLMHCTHPNSANNFEGFFDFQDGSRILNSEFFTQPNTLRIALFQDGFDVCNPLGSSKSKFKMIGVYMILLNLPPYLRSKINNIKLVLLCREKYISMFSWADILRDLIKDIKILETDGISINLPNKITFRGGLVAVLGDNLGSHQIGGFTESFGNTKHFCRYCEISRKEFEENPFNRKPLRTIESYEECALEARRRKTIVKGVKTNSALNDLKYFHVCDPGLPPCAAHDLFEGIVAYDLWQAVQYFMQKKWLKPYLFNYRVNNVSIVNTKKEFIPYLNTKSKSDRLTGSAIQLRWLLMILPIAIADLIKDFDDDVWQMVLKLRELSNLICAPALSDNQIILLESSTETYVKLRLKCFPKVKLRPKHEFIMHYGEMIRIFGPVKHCWTLRCESKHKYFKTIVKHIQNFKNITQTLAEKHELLQCSIEDQYSAIVKIDNPIEYKAENCETAAAFAISQYFCNKGNFTVKYITDKITYHEILYAKGMTICVSKNEYGNFIICDIKLILVENDYSEIYFVGNSKEIIYCPELGLYELENYDQNDSGLYNYSVFSTIQLLSPNPILQSDINSVPIFITKYSPFDPDD